MGRAGIAYERLRWVKTFGCCFTLNRFDGVAPIPEPGPAFIHEAQCERYVETAGYPMELVPFPVVLEGYDAEQMVRRRETVTDGSQEATMEEMVSDTEIGYVLVRSG